MALKKDNAEFLEHTIGMPVSHMEAFKNTAQAQKCVIIVRATGPTCHGLLEEGYDTKGYRIHGKSCDWGPMAGFVMRDPRLNKSGMAKAEFNRKKHSEAIDLDKEGQGWKAATTPLKISDERKNWLQTTGRITLTANGAGRFDGLATHESGVTFQYSLIKEGNLYGVYFDNSKQIKWTQQGAPLDYKAAATGTLDALQPMLAMTNPPEHRLSSEENYLNAVTGDYDLFSVWPFRESYNAGPYGDDHRPLGTVKGSIGDAERSNVESLERNFTQGGQGTKMGNITPRIFLICQTINSIVGRSVLWHSDEAARPFLDDVDLPVIAFIPKEGGYVGIETITDFKAFVLFCQLEKIQVTLSNAWAQDANPAKPNRLGKQYEHLVPADGQRIIVPDWYNL